MDLTMDQWMTPFKGADRREGRVVRGDVMLVVARVCETRTAGQAACLFTS